MSDKNVWRGLDPSSQVAVLLEVLLMTPTPSAGTAFSADVQATLDALTEARAQQLIQSYSNRLARAQWS